MSFYDSSLSRVHCLHINKQNTFFLRDSKILWIYYYQHTILFYYNNNFYVTFSSCLHLAPVFLLFLKIFLFVNSFDCRHDPFLNFFFYIVRKNPLKTIFLFWFIFCFIFWLFEFFFQVEKWYVWHWIFYNNLKYISVKIMCSMR